MLKEDFHHKPIRRTIPKKPYHCAICDKIISIKTERVTKRAIIAVVDSFYWPIKKIYLCSEVCIAEFFLDNPEEITVLKRLELSYDIKIRIQKYIKQEQKSRKRIQNRQNRQIKIELKKREQQQVIEKKQLKRQIKIEEKRIQKERKAKERKEAAALFKVYREKVKVLTEINYIQYHSVINPLNLTRGFFDYHIDHVFSIKEAFNNNIPTHVVANPYNLKMLPAKRNIIKGTNCDITREELISLFNQFLVDDQQNSLECQHI